MKKAIFVSALVLSTKCFSMVGAVGGAVAAVNATHVSSPVARAAVEHVDTHAVSSRTTLEAANPVWAGYLTGVGILLALGLCIGIRRKRLVAFYPVRRR